MGGGASSERLHFGGWAEELEDLLDVDAGAVVAEAVVAEEGAEGFAGGVFLIRSGVRPVLKRAGKARQRAGSDFVYSLSAA